MRTTLATAIAGLADMVGDYLPGTCTSIGAAVGATLIDARLKDKSYNQDDYFNNKIIWITAGTGVAGDERYILDFEASTGTVTPYYAFTVQVPNASTFLIFTRWTPGDYLRALNQAIHDAYPYVQRTFIDETLTTVANVWSYNLGDYGSGATVTYGATTVTDTAQAWQTNQFKGLTVLSGGNSGVAASNTATAITVAAWSPSTPTAGDEYQVIHPILDILNVSYQRSTTYTTRPYIDISFEPLDRDGTRVLQLTTYPPADRPLRITGRGKLTEWTSTVTSTSEIGQPQITLLQYLAAYHLFSKTPALSASQDREFYQSEAARFYDLWQRGVAARSTVHQPKRIVGGGLLR
jgi:hypothetical protein